MMSSLFTFVEVALIFLAVTIGVGGFSVMIAAMIKERGHLFKHHLTKDCPTC